MSCWILQSPLHRRFDDKRKKYDRTKQKEYDLLRGAADTALGCKNLPVQCNENLLFQV